MPPNPGTRRGHIPESRIEVMNVQEKLKRDLTPAMEKLKVLKEAATGPEKVRIEHTYVAMLEAMNGVSNAGKHKVSVEGYNGRPGYDQQEGVPVDEAIKILRAAETALPANSPERPGYASVIARLEQNSRDYFQAHYGKSSNADVVSGAAPLTPDEGSKQDMRVRQEAKLISQDYRASKNTDQAQRLTEDYGRGQADLNERREWNYSPVELPKTVGLVEASDSAETLAKMRADAEINKLQNQGNFLKRFWYKAMEEGKRASLYQSELQKISGKAKKPGWFARNILRRKAGPDEKQNLFQGTGQEGKHFGEMESLAKRFADDYIQRGEGEKRSQLTDPALNDRLNLLVHEYATGNMSDLEFENRKDTLVGDIKQANRGDFKKDILTADNFLEAARTFRKYVEHGGRLAQTDVKLQVFLGESRSRIKSEANLNWTERFIKRVEKNALGKFLKPAVIGYASSVAGFLLKRPLRGLVGAAGLGGLFGIFRRSKQVKQDIAMHRREREAGIPSSEGSGAKRREKVEGFVMQMEKSSEILASIKTLRAAFEANRTPENRAALLDILADTEARMALSAQTKRGLIEYDGESSLERNALDMMAALTQCKMQLGVGNITTTAEYKAAMADLRKEVEGKDKKAERYRRWEMVKAGLVGTATGFLAGAIAEEATDKLGETLISHFGHNKTWDWMDRPPHSTSFQRLGNFVHNFGNHQPGSHWWDWFKPDYKGCVAGPNVGPSHVDTGIIPGHGVKIDDTLRLVQDKCQPGLFHAEDIKSGQNVQDFAYVNNQLVQTGNINPEIKFNSIDVTTATGAGGATGAGHGGGESWWHKVESILSAKTQALHINTLYDNDTPKDYDLNELKFFMHQDASGMHADLSKIVEGESFHGGQELDLPQAINDHSIKLVLTDSHFANPVVLEPDAGGHLDIPNELKPFIHFNANGTINYKGDGWIGMVEQTGGVHNGAADINVINSIRGDGSVQLDSVVGGGGDLGPAGEIMHTTQNWEILRGFNDDQCGPDAPWAPMFVPLYRRNQLEMRNAAAGQGEGTEGGQTNEAAAAANANREARQAAGGGTETGHGTGEGAEGTHIDGDPDDHETTTTTARALTPEQRAAMTRAGTAISEFNERGDNEHPHISLVVDPHLMQNNPDAVIIRIQQLQEKLEQPLEDLRKNPQYRNRNFVFNFKAKKGDPVVQPDETVVLTFGLNQPINDIVPIFRRNLEGGLDYTRRLATPAPAARTAPAERAPAPAGETPAAKIARIQTELVAIKVGAEHRIHFDEQTNTMPEADKAKMLEAFSKAWPTLTETVRANLLEHDNPTHPVTEFRKGVVLGFVAGEREIKFDPQGRLLIPPNKTSTEVASWLERNANGTPAPAPAGGGGGRPPRPARGGGHP